MTTSTNDGAVPDDAAIATDETGDVLFAILVLAERATVDAEAALDEWLPVERERRFKYTGRVSGV